MNTSADIKITNEHTFPTWGKFDIIHNNNIYQAEWKKVGKTKTLKTNAPEVVYKRIYNYLFNENI